LRIREIPLSSAKEKNLRLRWKKTWGKKQNMSPLMKNGDTDGFVTPYV